MDINYPLSSMSSPSDGEECVSETDGGFKSNVAGAGHPIWSSVGLIESINFARSVGNTSEQQLSGQVQDSVFQSMAKAEMQFKIPASLIAFCMDWDNDITSGGGDASGAAQKILSYINELRSTLGRDPSNADVFGAYAVGGASQLKQIMDKAQQQPEEEADGGGGKKDDIIYKKLKNNQPVKRKWREVYDFFKRRAPAGLVTFSDVIGSADSSSSSSGGSSISSVVSNITSLIK